MRDDLRLVFELLLSEIKQSWQWLAIGETSVLISELIEVRIKESYEWLWALKWVVSEESCHEVYGLSWSSVSEDLLPGERLDLGESILGVVRVHCENLLP